jgi:transposase, IS30 family
MKKTFKHLVQSDRDRIDILLKAGHSQREIADVLDMDKSTISREIKKGRPKSKEYNATVAHRRARSCRRLSKYQGMRVESLPGLKEYIISQLKEKRSPDEIAGRMKREGIKPRIGKDAIYRWLYSNRGQRYAKYLCTKRYKPKKRDGKKIKWRMIPERISIHKRPLGATNRTRYQHFEGDTAVAPMNVNNNEAIAVLAGRKSKLLLATKMQSLSPKKMNKAIKQLKKKVKIKSLTLDNGQENRHHLKWKLSTYFADPYSPWQKPLVESSIGLLRRWFFKKGTDWATVSEEELQNAINLINNKHRKSLNYASAIEVAVANGIITSDYFNKRCISPENLQVYKKCGLTTNCQNLQICHR